jgi:hypothetical protein
MFISPLLTHKYLLLLILRIPTLVYMFSVATRIKFVLLAKCSPTHSSLIFSKGTVQRPAIVPIAKDNTRR